VTSDLGSEIQSWKHSKPSSLLAQEYATALMRVTLGVSMGLLAEQDSEDLGQSPEVLGVLMMEVSQQRESSWICAVTVARKRCCQIPSQLRDCSR